MVLADGPWIATAAERAIGVFTTWLMVSTFNVSDGRLSIAVPLWSDFGPTTASITLKFSDGSTRLLSSYLPDRESADTVAAKMMADLGRA